MFRFLFLCFQLRKNSSKICFMHYSRVMRKCFKSLFLAFCSQQDVSVKLFHAQYCGFKGKVLILNHDAF
jgi:hypothetical protein